MDNRSKTYLESFLQTLNKQERGKYSSFGSDHFCADEKNANTCSDLIRRGIKTATCSMKYWYQVGGERMPTTGHLEVVTNWDGKPTSIIEITSVTESRFCDLTKAFARAKGEGDQSLEGWRNAHWNFFSRECLKVGIEPSEEMMLVLERFKVVYQQEFEE